MVLDDEEGDIFGLERAEMVGDFFCEAWVHAGDGLVQQNQARRCHQCPAELQQLFLAAGQGGCRVVQDARQVQPRGNCLRARPGLGFRRPAPSQRRRNQAFARLALGIEQQIVEHAEACDAAGQLERSHQARLGDAIGPPPGDVGAIEAHHSRIRPQHAADALERRRLACPVRPDQRGDRARLHREPCPPERLHAAEAAAKAGDFQQRRHRR